jgi:hypothetical protein
MIIKDSKLQNFKFFITPLKCTNIPHYVSIKYVLAHPVLLYGSEAWTITKAEE